MDAEGPFPEQSRRRLTPRGSGCPCTAQSSSYPDRNRDLPRGQPALPERPPPRPGRSRRLRPARRTGAAGGRPRHSPHMVAAHDQSRYQQKRPRRGTAAAPVLIARPGRAGPCLPAHWAGSGRWGRSARGPQRVGARRGQSPAAALRVLPPARPRPAPPCRGPEGLARAAEGWGSGGEAGGVHTEEAGQQRGGPSCQRRRPGSSSRGLAVRGVPHYRVFSVKNTHTDQHMQE